MRAHTHTRTYLLTSETQRYPVTAVTLATNPEKCLCFRKAPERTRFDPRSFHTFPLDEELGTPGRSLEASPQHPSGRGQRAAHLPAFRLRSARPRTAVPQNLLDFIDTSPLFYSQPTNLSVLAEDVIAFMDGLSSRKVQQAA